jgi:hypothetical protein
VPPPLRESLLSAKDLNGRVITAKDRDRILKALQPVDAGWAIDAMVKIPLAGCAFRIPWGKRHPDSIHQFEWLDADGIIAEATEHQPGIAALKNGYFPVGRDPEGNPNSCFLRCASFNDPGLYQIYQDKVGEDGCLESRSVKQMLPDVAALAKFLRA